MDPIADINAGIVLVDAILSWIGKLKSQHGLTNDQIAAQWTNDNSDNAARYRALIASLKGDIG